MDGRRSGGGVEHERPGTPVIFPEEPGYYTASLPEKHPASSRPRRPRTRNTGKLVGQRNSVPMGVHSTRTFLGRLQGNVRRITQSNPTKKCCAPGQAER